MPNGLNTMNIEQCTIGARITNGAQVMRVTGKPITFTKKGLRHVPVEHESCHFEHLKKQHIREDDLQYYEVCND